MLLKGNYQENGGGIKPYIFTDDATKRKVRKHIRDINDVITEKDIKDAKVPGLDETPVPPPPPAKKGRKKNKNQVVDDTPGNPVTPWDIIND